MALILKHQTVEAFVNRFRAWFRDATQEDVVKGARFVIARLQAGDITDAQFRAVFGLNVTQWNTLKTKMQNLITADNAVKSAVGE